MFLLIDNYDSFTFNLVQLFQKMDIYPVVIRNDQREIMDILEDPSLKAVVISPGPGGPEDSGLCISLLYRLSKDIPVLGVCLGHQVLGYFAGYKISRAKRIMHGKTSPIFHTSHPVFKEVASPFSAVRYHSLAIDITSYAKDKRNIPIDVIAKSDDGEIMAISYIDRPWIGIQFHPESILSIEGPKIVKNFVDIFVKKK